MTHLPNLEELRQQLILIRDADYSKYRGYKDTIPEFIDTIDTLIGALDDCAKKHRTREQDRVTYELMARMSVNIVLETMTSEFIVPRKAKELLQSRRKET